MAAEEEQEPAGQKTSRKSMFSMLSNNTIARIKLTNFMSYDAVEIYPGPGLNLVIGPNGSGKSTLVCAIALGLGGTPDLLSRAKNLSGFIKRRDDGTQAECAEIEIELNNRGGEPYIIRRILHRAGSGGGKARKGSKDAQNQSTVYYNGNQIDPATLKDRLSRLNIRIDNMCQFLPQDKVSMFSRLNEQELLVETIRAGLGESMVTRMVSLGKLQDQVRSSANTAENERAELAQYEAELERLHSALEAYERLESFKKQLRSHEAKIDYKKFQAARDAYKALSAQVKQLKKAKQAATEEEAKADAALKKIVKETHKSRHGDAEKGLPVLLNVAKHTSNLSRGIRDHAQRSEAAADNIKDVLMSRQTAKTKVEEKQQEVAKLDQAIAKWEEENDVKALKEARNRATFERDKLRQENSQVQAQSNELNATIEELRAVLNTAQHRARGLQKEMHAPESVFKLLNKINGGTLHQGWRMVKEMVSAGSIGGKVYLPILSIKPKSTEIASQLERVISQKQLVTLMTEHPADRSKLMSVKGLDCLVLNSSREPRRVDPQFMKEIKAIGHADELFEAPDVVVRGLCDIAGIDKVVIGSAETEHILLNMDEERLKHTLVNMRVVTPHHEWSLRASRYGEKDVLINTRIYREFPMPRFLGASMKNDESERRLKGFLEQEVATKERLASVESELAQLQPRLAEAATRREAIHREERKAAERIKDYNALRIRHRTAGEQLARAQRSLNGDPRPEVEANVESVTTSCLGMVGVMEEKVGNICAGGAALSTMAGAIMRSAAENAKRAVAQQFHQVKMQELQRAHQTLERTAAESQRVKNEAQQLKETFNEKWGGEIEQLTDAFQSISDDMDELLATAMLFRKRIDSATTDESAIERYKKVKEKVEDLREKEADRQEQNANDEKKLETELADWTKKVRLLISRVNDNFERSFALVSEKGYHCKGSVALEMVQDNLKESGVVIKVSFRKDQPPRRLDVTVQSGGERSLSTFMYLLALNEVSKVPFRVVDEINQGMDEDKERISMQRLFDSASNPGSGQYFLITPKLLAGMRYHDNITFHVIFNGDGALPSRKMQMAKFLAAPRDRGVKRSASGLDDKDGKRSRVAALQS
ncbi:Structural maintenance of chromosomes protein 5 [Hondaea fermentalgiana]|uniref:Structural maintenance of chromosomes protein 5 n=1 Tax=Hondaea fermentalgiana TaxID=2315210 RepID=A0A2R5GSY1_9STRA|nr:Structural maintenance of chromosomes protein 5 [Hondaea fermentalgiana]|eukprot:GBG33976.1 Structural maintenance of chromosomes protein 5 [Hondaea fermentalgiana]